MKKMKEYNKYRVGFRGSMPNYEKTARSEALQAKIQKAREVRWDGDYKAGYDSHECLC